MQQKFFITTPIYYVNDEPHLGHAYSTVIADILARYHRLFGHQVFFLTGTDEHGQKVAEAARKAGRNPQEHCDLLVQRYQTVWQKLEISHDDFLRTTEKRHTQFVQEVLQKLWGAGEIYPAEYEGWYCIPEERFWTEKDLVSGNCPSCGREVSRLAEKNYFFRMGKYQDWLIEYIQAHPRFILPESRRNEVLGFLSKPLGDLCISRPKERLAWGIPIPFDPEYVTYVWFDALLNYVSAPAARGGGWWPANLHLIGKDILTTHSVYWPTMLQAAGLEMPETIFGHGWWLAQDAKMSKSLGNVVKPLELADKYGVDAFRFFLVREMSLGMDASFSEAALINRYNSELANDLGNLFSRLLKLINTFCGGKIPPADVESKNGSQAMASPPLCDRVHDAIIDLRLNAALDEIMAFVRGINKRIEEFAPWKTGKADPQGTRKFLRQALADLSVAASLLHPVMPIKMKELLSVLGIEAGQPATSTMSRDLPAGRTLPEKASLFPRVKFEPLAEAPKSAASAASEIPLITIDDFRRIQLKVARIISAQAVPGADKLLQLEIDLGSEKRTVVAGIARHYQPEQLVGKSAVMVANLQPTRIRGVVSEGMLLAVEDGGKLVLVAPEGEVTPGSKIS